MRSQDIEIPEPCHAAWEDMRPEDRGRYCFECKTKVHDLSSMTQREAEQFLRRTACEDVCVSYEHTDEGEIVFRQPAPVVPISRLTRRRSVAATLASAGVAAALAACTPHSSPEAEPEAEAVVAFEAPSMVIPVEPPETTEPPAAVEPTETPETTVEPIAVSDKDEPCDPTASQTSKEVTPTPVVGPPTHRVRGRMPIRRTAGKPVRKVGKVAPSF